MKLNNQLEENKRLSEEIINKEKFKNNYFVNLSQDRKSTRLNSSHSGQSRMPSSA